MNRSTPVTRREYEELARRVRGLRRRRLSLFFVDVLATALGIVLGLLLAGLWEGMQ